MEGKGFTKKPGVYSGKVQSETREVKRDHRGLLISADSTQDFLQSISRKDEKPKERSINCFCLPPAVLRSKRVAKEEWVIRN